MKVYIKNRNNNYKKTHKFHQYKRPISIKKESLKIVVSNKVSFGKKGFKYFIGSKDANKVRPLCIFFPKMSAYGRDCDETDICLFDKR